MFVWKKQTELPPLAAYEGGWLGPLARPSLLSISILAMNSASPLHKGPGRRGRREALCWAKMNMEVEVQGAREGGLESGHQSGIEHECTLGSFMNLHLSNSKITVLK